ncbi:hypothetical protein GQ457_09G025930 [Hibiscus cannabinus]
MKCAMRVLYSCAGVKVDPVVFAINFIGLYLHSYFLRVYFEYANDQKKRIRDVCIVLCQVVLTMVITIVAVFCFPSRRALFIRIAAHVFSTIMYAHLWLSGKKVVITVCFPLTYFPLRKQTPENAENIFRKMFYDKQTDPTRNVEYMPFWLSLVVCNGLGAMFGAIQQFVYVYFCEKGVMVAGKYERR